MRDYILTESISRDSTFAFPKLRRVVRNWVFKRTLKTLQQLDDHMLLDIGLARDELRHLAALPLDVDLLAELIRLRDLRARHMAPPEEAGPLPVKRPEPAQPVAAGDAVTGFDVRSYPGLAASPGG